MKQKIHTHLWFNQTLEEAVKLYTEVFDDSQIYHSFDIYNTPSGDVKTIMFRLNNLHFVGLNAGPEFEFNPSVSFSVNCESKEEVDRIYGLLVSDILMPLQEYDFNPYYGWIVDRFGVSWQLILRPEARQKIVPTLLFADDRVGKAQEALDFYSSVFVNSTVDHLSYYNGQAQDPRARLAYSELNVFNQQFILMDHGAGGRERFNEAISFMIFCETEQELDYYWELLSDDPSAEQCGWLKDKFGVSWQIVPSEFNAWIKGLQPDHMARVMDVFLTMKKIDMNKLRSVQ